MKKKSNETKHKQRNHVAQHSWNKSGAGAHRDRTKYTRKEKHKKGPSGPFYLVKLLFSPR